MKNIFISFFIVLICLISQAQVTQIGQDIDGQSGDEAGKSVAMNAAGDIVAVGAWKHYNADGTGWSGSSYFPLGGPSYASNEGKGQVRVFQWDGSSWAQIGDDLEGEYKGNHCAWSLDINDAGTIVAMGSIYNGGHEAGQGRAAKAGSVRVFQWDGSSWNLMGDNIDGMHYHRKFGWSLSLSSDGTRIVIGEPNGPSNNRPNGSIFVYDWDGSTWNQVGATIIGPDGGPIIPNAESTGVRLGTSVDMHSSGNYFVAGAPLYRSSWSEREGAAYVYEWNAASTNWQQLGSIIVGENNNESIGHSVTISDNASGNLRVAVGAIGNYYNYSSPGLVRVYDWSGSDWVQYGQDINGNAAGDYLGTTVALSSNGQYLAIGATDTDFNGNDSGQVLYFEDIGNSWNLVESIDGESPDDKSGSSLAMSADGTKLAIGSIENDDNGSNSGHVRVFSTQSHTLTMLVNGVGSTSPLTGTYLPGYITIQAQPTNGYLFTGWSGDLEQSYNSELGSSVNFLLNSNMTITANFSLDADDDGLTNNEEVEIGTNPRSTVNQMQNMYNMIQERVTIEEAQNLMIDLRAGSTIIDVNEGIASLSLTLEETDNIQGSNWTVVAEVIEVDLPATNDVEFFRFRME
jgi:hypothetical protein